jgi:hypothetical protein
MKNLYVLPTDKPSRLSILNSGKLNFGAEIMSSSNSKPQHIYITSDEEIKEGNWCYQVELNDGKVDKCYDITLYHTWTNNGVDKTRKYKKIILTTDQELIADGVQAIDDEFLEWFVENPSCESIEVKKTFITNSGLGYQEYVILNVDFEVLEVVAKIPQSIYEVGKVTKLDDYEYVSIYELIIPQEEPKQETLEEAAERFYPLSKGGSMWMPSADDCNKANKQEGFIEGAKWQAERMYSEEEVQLIASKLLTDLKNGNAGNSVEWFEQFKKK